MGSYKRRVIIHIKREPLLGEPLNPKGSGPHRDMRRLFQVFWRRGEQSVPSATTDIRDYPSSSIIAQTFNGRHANDQIVMVIKVVLIRYFAASGLGKIN